MAEYFVITDTSCLILFDKLGIFDLLNQIYPRIITTPQIAAEFGKQLPNWLEVMPVKQSKLINQFAHEVDNGEASAIALAYEIENSLLILDDGKARKLAERLKLNYIGTIGILITARKQDKISSLRPYFEMITATNFRIASSILDRILNDFGD